MISNRFPSMSSKSPSLNSIDSSSSILSYTDYKVLYDKTSSWFSSLFNPHPLLFKAFSSQEALLNTHIPSTYFNCGLVDIGNNEFLNTLEILSEHEQSSTLFDVSNTKGRNVLVMLHGFGAGLGFFYKNYLALSKIPNYKVYSVDWLGMGNSSRHRKLPTWATNKTESENVSAVDDYFINSLETWREKQHIDKFVLMGHSLGGYLVTAYAEKYPERIQKLILVSPAGVAIRPENLPPNSFSSGTPIPKFLSHLWNYHVTPQRIVRAAGPFGSRLLKNYTHRRFNHLEERELVHFHDYFYHISAQPGSGEYSYRSVFSPGIFARKPLHTRIQKFNFPITFLYGSTDWMDYKSSIQALSTPEMQQKKEEYPHKVILIKQAGHHLYNDNPDAFNLALEKELTGDEYDYEELAKNGVDYVFK